jgi:GNAT superfamily N-acetyltransferase
MIAPFYAPRPMRAPARPAARVRPARAPELRAAISVLRSAGLGTNVGRLLDYPMTSPQGDVLVALDGDAVVGGAAVARFGATGWIGALGVTSSARRRGVGGALTEGAVSWLRERGAETVLLYATVAGRPVYERAGFVAEGEAHAWRDLAPPPARGALPDGVRPLQTGDLAAVRALDAAATGEDRGSVFAQLGPGAPGFVAERGGALAASAVRSPWGLGPSVVAANGDAALSLLSALRRAPGSPLTLSLPDANLPAVQALRDWGFQPINAATRMRLGPAPAYDPRHVFGMFNLFWG